MRAFVAVVVRDLQLALRIGGGGFLAVVFFVVTVTLVPLGVGPELNILARIAPGMIWVAALLATLLSLDRLFQADYEDGSLDLLALAPLPLGATVLAKCLAHWLGTGLPLIAVAPVLALLLNMPLEGMLLLMLTMLIGTPALSLIGAIGAALTLGVRRGGVLLSLLILPLYVPILIFGVSAVDAAILSLDPLPHVLLLTAVLLAAIVLCPWAATAALRLHLS